MTERLTIRLLGGMTVSCGNDPVTGLGTRKAEALLAYLVMQKRPFSREVLADLLWDDRPPKQAQANLRSLLSGLRRKLDDHLIITRQTIAFNHDSDYWLDAAAFVQQTAGSNQQLTTAVSLYHGDFLAGFYIREARRFEEWASLERERLQRTAVLALRQLIRHHHDNGQYEESMQYTLQLLALNPLNEEAHRQKMMLLARMGQRAAALQQYQTCRQMLADELGVEPAPATMALYERLRQRPSPSPNLPPAPTPFIGRETERSQLIQHLSRPDCRLLSIIGPGGVGKTRLLIAATRHIIQQRPGQFLDGIYFIPLDTLESVEFLATTLADALQFTFQGAEEPQQQILNYLKDREILLVIDNFEHLITEGSLACLTSILTAAPAVKIMLTSRERLKLIEEQTFDLRGLNYPSDAHAAAESYGAVQLFQQHATRVHPTFSPTTADMEAIVELCQLVDGMPLAIELAAAGVRYFSCRHIVQQLQARLDFGGEQIRSRLPRHQNLTAVFEYSWRLLAEPEQQAAQRLAVFHAPFDMAAAEAVTGTAVSQLIVLHDKSFLQRHETDLFTFHPLIHQFLVQKLTTDPLELARIHTRHVDYYIDCLRAAKADKGVDSNMERAYFAIQALLQTSGDDIIAAAIWLAEQRNFADRKLVTFIEILNFYFQSSHRNEEWKVVYQRLIQALQKDADGSDEERWLIAVLEARIASADIYLHAYDRARPRLESALITARELENGALISACLRELGVIALRAGDYDTARRQTEAAVAAVAEYARQYKFRPYRILGEIAFAAGQWDRAEQIYETFMADALKLDSYDEVAPDYELAMGKLAQHRGDFERARGHLETAVRLARKKGVQGEIFASLNQLGHLFVDLKAYEEARQLLAEAEVIAASLKDDRLTAVINQTWGWWAESQADWSTARQFYQRSLTLFEQVRDQASVPPAQANLARVNAACRMADVTDDG